MEPTIETIAQTWPLWVAFVALQVLLNGVDITDKVDLNATTGSRGSTP